MGAVGRVGFALCCGAAACFGCVSCVGLALRASCIACVHAADLVARHGTYTVQNPILAGKFLGTALVHGLDERAHADAQRPADIAFVHLKHQRGLAARFLHQADYLVGKVGIVAAAEADDLHELHVGALCGKHAGGKHARVEVVHHVDKAVLQRHLFAAWHRIGSEHGDAALGEQRGQVVVHQRVVVVGTPRQHHGVGAVVARLRQHFRSAFL